MSKASTKGNEDILFIHWDRAIPGREGHAGELFQSTLAYLEEQREARRIDSFEPIMLSAYGGDVAGFFLIRGQLEQIDRLQAEEDFIDLITNATTVLRTVGVVRGVRGRKLQSAMERWGRHTKRFTR